MFAPFSVFRLTDIFALDAWLIRGWTDEKRKERLEESET